MTRERVHSGRQGTPGLGLLRDLAGIALPAHIPELLSKAAAATPYACNAEMAYSKLQAVLGTHAHHTHAC